MGKLIFRNCNQSYTAQYFCYGTLWKLDFLHEQSETKFYS